MVLNTYEVIDTVNSAIQAGHFPNLESVSRKLSGGNASTYEQLTHYAKSCVQGALDYFEKQLTNSMKGCF